MEHGAMMAITECPLPARARNSLIEAHIYYLDEVTVMENRDLLAVKGIGTKSLAAIRNCLSKSSSDDKQSPGVPAQSTAHHFN